MATYCIGDIHGCYRELQDLLDEIGASYVHDHFWFVGDLVNRGPDSLAVLRFVKNLPHKVVVLGNHDFYLLAIYYQALPQGLRHYKHTLNDILVAADRVELIDWLRAQPLMHYDAAGDWVLSHAGIYPWWDLAAAQKYNAEVMAILGGEENNAHSLLSLSEMFGNEPDKWRDDLVGDARWRFIINSFTRMRFCTLAGGLDFLTQGPIGTQPADLVPWFQVRGRSMKNQKIIFGHWAAIADEIIAKEVNIAPNIFALDTGCVWGNKLTALRLDDCQVFSVSAKKNKR